MRAFARKGLFGRGVSLVLAVVASFFGHEIAFLKINTEINIDGPLPTGDETLPMSWLGGGWMGGQGG